MRNVVARVTPCLHETHVSDTSDSLCPLCHRSFSKHRSVNMATNISERYDFTKESKGMALIFNNVEFQELKKREGSDDDLENLKEAFESMGFDESDIWLYRNQTAVKMEQIVEGCMKRAGHAKPDCFVCVILSHGGSLPEGVGHRRVMADYVWGTDGSIPLRNLMDLVQNCQALDGKPKIFIVQACRGCSVSEPVPVEEPVQPPKPDAGPPPSDLPEAEPSFVEGGGMGPSREHGIPYEIPVEEDCLLYYATQPGFFSFRGKTCSPFVQHFCKQVEDNKDTELDFLSLLTRVNHDVAFKHESYKPSESGLHKKKQMPWIASRLTKTIVFGGVK